MRGPASRGFKSVVQAQKFVTAHAAMHKLFTLGRLLPGQNIIEITGQVHLLSGAGQLPDRWALISVAQ